jgi:hypothetical protein
MKQRSELELKAVFCKAKIVFILIYGGFCEATAIWEKIAHATLI